jgi:hypothetical protein
MSEIDWNTIIDGEIFESNATFINTPAAQYPIISEIDAEDNMNMLSNLVNEEAAAVVVSETDNLSEIGLEGNRG